MFPVLKEYLIKKLEGLNEDESGLLAVKKNSAFSCCESALPKNLASSGAHLIQYHSIPLLIVTQEWLVVTIT